MTRLQFLKRVSGQGPDVEAALQRQAVPSIRFATDRRADLPADSGEMASLHQFRVVQTRETRTDPLLDEFVDEESSIPRPTPDIVAWRKPRPRQKLLTPFRERKALF